MTKISKRVSYCNFVYVVSSVGLFWRVSSCGSGKQGDDDVTSTDGYWVDREERFISTGCTCVGKVALGNRAVTGEQKGNPTIGDP